MEIIRAGWVHVGPVGVNVEGFRVSILYGHWWFHWCRDYGFRRQRQQELVATRLKHQQREGPSQRRRRGRRVSGVFY